MATLESMFRTGDSKRDNFLSRVFGIFSEEVVRYWCASPRSKYEDLGRPTLHTPEGKWHTLDFTLRDRETSKTYVAELKCELAYDNYRYLRLTDARQLDHHVGAAFQRFLEMTREGHGLTVKVGAKPVRTGWSRAGVGRHLRRGHHLREASHRCSGCSIRRVDDRGSEAMARHWMALSN
jgi:hypothetical protein